MLGQRKLRKRRLHHTGRRSSPCLIGGWTLRETFHPAGFSALEWCAGLARAGNDDATASSYEESEGTGSRMVRSGAGAPPQSTSTRLTIFWQQFLASGSGLRPYPSLARVFFFKKKTCCFYVGARRAQNSSKVNFRTIRLTCHCSSLLALTYLPTLTLSTDAPF